MKVKLMQWNIGGGRIRNINSAATTPESYTQDGLEYICEFISKHNPDIITLEETHESERYSQAKIIADKIGHKYFVNNVYDKSHLEAGQGLGQAIISKYLT